jgi:NAD(P)H-hydrate repair Nnr-like enzyme with NAD(P)H-hydrate dehydratase domain
MVRFVGAEHPAGLVRAAWPEAVTGDGRVQAWAIGPGLDLDPSANPAASRAAVSAVSAVADGGPPVLVDAGALPVLVDRVLAHGPLDPARSPVLATPHAGELVRLLAALGLGEPARAAVEERPLHHARAAAAATGAVVLLKGATTLVVPPAGACWAQADAPPWLATAGAGDVLAGVAGALLAAGLPPARAGALAALVHGRAAVAANPGGPVSAAAVSAAVPGVVAALLGGPAGGGRRR